MNPLVRAIVQKDLLDGISARVKELGQGGYARVYRSKGRQYPTSLHLLVSRILDAAGVEYRTDEPLFPASSRRGPTLRSGTGFFCWKETSARRRGRRPPGPETSAS